MQKNVVTIAVIIISIIALSAGLWIWSSHSSNLNENQEATPIISDIIFFYGKECSHCIETEKFLAENNIAEKVKFDLLEVWYNKKNAALLQEKALECNLKKEEIAVPFLYSNGECLIGSPKIEKFFQDKANGQ
jgi:glutaredoxin